MDKLGYVHLISCNPIEIDAHLIVIILQNDEDDIDALAAAISDSKTTSDDIHKLLPKEVRLHQNPFIDATAYIRSGSVVQRTSSQQNSKADIKHRQLKKYVNNGLLKKQLLGSTISPPAHTLFF